MENKKEITIVKAYQNKVAQKIGNISGLVLIIGGFIAVIGGIVVVNYNYDASIMDGIKFAICVFVPSFIFYIIGEGFAEIIQLLQDIKNK